MTCTHAAMIRQQLIDMNFHYDSVIMEESGQILDIESFIPCTLQSSSVDTTTTTSNSNNTSIHELQRLVMIGDHYQLPPIVKHVVLAKYNHFEQSLFSRFIHLSVPYILLHAQGRARVELSAIYAHHYKQISSVPTIPTTTNITANHNILSLQNLNIVDASSKHCLPVYKYGNAGFANTFQIINVEDFQGRGETCPTPYYYQNLGEAEYIVAVYQYMRLIGYPKDKITILTTYNGQKALLLEILSVRCEKNNLFGMPTVSTVDQYQGQQNDYILLSLVRTTSVGYLRDIRRCIVAMSRAKLGLYIFGRVSLYQSCLDISSIFNYICNTNSSSLFELKLIANELYPCQRTICKDENGVIASNIVNVKDVVSMGILVYQMVQLVLQQPSQLQHV